MSGHKVVLLPLFRSYKKDGGEKALYEATRGIWKIDDEERRSLIEYAFGVFNRKIVSVYKPDADGWQPGGTATYDTRPSKETNNPDKWEFTATVKPPQEIVDSCLHKFVGHCLPPRHERLECRILMPLPPGRSAAFILTKETW